MTGSELRVKASALRLFSTGSAAIDTLLGGGLRAGRLVEVFGRSSSGKTQLAMKTALFAARAGTKALYVDTEGAFRPERLESMCSALKWDAATLLRRIVYSRIDSSSEQMEAVRRMAKREATASCRLVVIDTLSRNFSIDLPGRANLSSRQESLNVHLSEMARDAFLNERAYLLTNRVTFGPGHDVGIGGSTVRQLVHASVRLERERSSIEATLVATGQKARATLSEGGID
jgi:RecA/RadA recombinase